MKSAILILAILITIPSMAAYSWENCEKKVIKNLIAKGIREYGDPSSYTGVGGAGAYEYIIKACGYKPMTKKDCDNIYINTYLSCREGKSMTTVEESYILGYDPKILEYARLSTLCGVKDRITRKEFGSMMCGGK